MNAIDNGKIQEDDISLGLLLNTLDGERDAPLVFYYDGLAGEAWLSYHRGQSGPVLGPRLRRQS